MPEQIANGSMNIQQKNSPRKTAFSRFATQWRGQRLGGLGNVSTSYLLP